MEEKRQLLLTLSKLVKASRAGRLEEVARRRRRGMNILLDNIFDSGNENAIIRTMEGMGVQTLHRVSSGSSDIKVQNKKETRTDSGARKWISIHEWSNISDCIQHLKTSGLLIVSSYCRPDTKTPFLHELVLPDRPMVLAFGNEIKGISDELLQQSDLTFRLPMIGFTTSYNVSVSIGMCLYYLHIMEEERLGMKKDQVRIK